MPGRQPRWHYDDIACFAAIALACLFGSLGEGLHLLTGGCHSLHGCWLHGPVAVAATASASSRVGLSQLDVTAATAPRTAVHGHCSVCTFLLQFHAGATAGAGPQLARPQVAQLFALDSPVARRESLGIRQPRGPPLSTAVGIS